MTNSIFKALRYTGRTTRLFDIAKKHSYASKLKVYFVVASQIHKLQWEAKIELSNLLVVTSEEAILLGIMTKECIPVTNNRTVYIDHAVIEELLQVQLNILFQTSNFINLPVSLD